MLVALAAVLAAPVATAPAADAAAGSRATAGAAAAPAPCPTAYAPPDPDRPQLRLAFALDARDTRVVHGRERVTFRPDLAVDELVFRLVPQGTRSRDAGGGLRVSAVTVDGLSRSWSVAGDGTLLRVPLPRVPAGRLVDAYLAFTLRLPVGADERLGARGETRWWGSGFPLLAWERGRGWATEPGAPLGEAVTSEAAVLRDLAVTAPTGLTVVSNASPGAVTTSGASRTWHASAPSVRDVVVAVGRFRHATVAVGRTPVVAVVAPGLPDDPGTVAARAAAGMRTHAARFGPFPYPRLVVPVVPDLRGGVEYPGAYLVGTGEDDATPTHEVAHQWFYGLVGNDQARDPWLDEALASYADALDRGTTARYLSAPIPAEGRGRVGAPMTTWSPFWPERSAVYFRSVYTQGGAALLRGRQREGADRFDAALRCWVNAQAHRVATPASLAAALADLPAALEELRRAGALPR